MAEGKACFIRVDETFDPVFRARAILALAHNAWADELERTSDASTATIARMIQAWCELKRVSPPALRLSDVPLTCP